MPGSSGFDPDLKKVWATVSLSYARPSLALPHPGALNDEATALLSYASPTWASPASSVAMVAESCAHAKAVPRIGQKRTKTTQRSIAEHGDAQLARSHVVYTTHIMDESKGLAPPTPPDTSSGGLVASGCDDTAPGIEPVAAQAELTAVQSVCLPPWVTAEKPRRYKTHEQEPNRLVVHLIRAEGLGEMRSTYVWGSPVLASTCVRPHLAVM